MKLLIIGDVVGRAGREAVLHHVPRLRETHALDAVIVNGENAAAGFGITGKICVQFYGVGVDCITTGNHVWDQKETARYIESDAKLLRPHNLPGQPGRGTYLFHTESGGKVLVVHLIGQLGMGEYAQNPFLAVNEVLDGYTRGGNVDAIVVDYHGEATSEKYGMAHHLDGRVSVLVGTHTHVPTADTRVFPGGMAFQCDLGMTGDYHSIIGMDPAIPLKKFLTKMKAGKMQPAMGEPTLCGMMVEIKEGRAVTAEPVRVGGKLAETCQFC